MCCCPARVQIGRALSRKGGDGGLVEETGADFLMGLLVAQGSPGAGQSIESAGAAAHCCLLLPPLPACCQQARVDCAPASSQYASADPPASLLPCLQACATWTASSWCLCAAAGSWCTPWAQSSCWRQATCSTCQVGATVWVGARWQRRLQASNSLLPRPPLQHYCGCDAVPTCPFTI